jgi:hypothetical protein
MRGKDRTLFWAAICVSVFGFVLLILILEIVGRLL